MYPPPPEEKKRKKFLSRSLSHPRVVMSHDTEIQTIPTPHCDAPKMPSGDTGEKKISQKKGGDYNDIQENQQANTLPIFERKGGGNPHTNKRLGINQLTKITHPSVTTNITAITFLVCPLLLIITTTASCSSSDVSPHTEESA